MRKRLIVLMVLVWSSQWSYAQHEPIFTQYGMNQTMFNPAYVVVNDVLSFSLMSRVQWVGIEGAPFTNTLIGSTTFFSNKGGAGITLVSNTYGVTTNQEIFAQAAYKIQLGLYTQLSLGIQGGYLIYENDYSNIDEAIFDPVFSNLIETLTEPNVGFGIFFNTDIFYLGLSIPKYIEYKSSETGSTTLTYNRHYYGSVGVVLPLGLLKLKTTGLIVLSENDESYELGASILLVETIWAGLFTRNLTAFGAMGQLKLTDRLKVGLTAELPSTDLVTNQYGSYEIFISWEMAVIKKQLLKRRYF